MDLQKWILSFLEQRDQNPTAAPRGVTPGRSMGRGWKRSMGRGWKRQQISRNETALKQGIWAQQKDQDSWEGKLMPAQRLGIPPEAASLHRVGRGKLLV